MSKARIAGARVNVDDDSMVTASATETGREVERGSVVVGQEQRRRATQKGRE